MTLPVPPSSSPTSITTPTSTQETWTTLRTTDILEVHRVAKNVTDVFFKDFGPDKKIIEPNQEMIEKIEEYLYEAQQMTKHEPVVNLKVTVDIGEGLLVMVECDRDKNVTLELKTDNMEMKLVKKNFDVKKPDESTVMSNRDNMMILPDQKELINDEGNMQITMASHYNLQVIQLCDA